MDAPKGFLARVLQEKMNNDTFLSELDYTKWYSINLKNSKFHICTKYQETFIDLHGPDNITSEWIENTRRNSQKLCKQLWHFFAKIVLSLCLSQTDLNGILRRGSMFICSECQFETLLQRSGFLDKLKHPLHVSTRQYWVFVM